MKKKVNKYQKGGGISLPVLYTDNPRKVQAYQDSLNLYNKSKKQLSQIKLNERDTPVYLRKGISPRLILQPEYDFVNYQGYNTSGRFEDNMNPNNSFPAPKIKQTIMPIGGIGVNTGNSMGGWYDIYKKPVQPYKLKKKTKKKPKPPSQQPQPVNISSVEILQPVPQDMGITPTPQPTGYPVYGPGNSLIGTVTSSGEFTPASYMGINRRDIDLLKNEQQLAQYLQSKGINTPLIKQQYGGATRSDSLNVLNNALRVRDYYNKTGNYTKGPSKRVYGSNVFPSIDEDYNFFLYNNGLQVINYPTRSGTLHEYGRLPVETYRKNIDKNKFYQREGASNILDTRAPMQLYDRRIQPTHEKAYRNINTKDVMYGDSVGIYEYDPLSVTPWDMLKPKQRDERIKKYGVTGTPYKSVKDYEKSKIQNSDRKKIRVKVTRKPNAASVTQAPVTQDVTLPPPVTQEVVPPSQAPSVQQPVGYPVYGPSRSLIGNVTSSGQFTPTSYLGMNRGDLDLLNNQEQLSQYLRSQGINTPLIKQPLVKQQYGGKISFPTSPTSSDSLNLYNRALEIQKYYDSKKYKKEPLEKSPDEVRANHEKEIQRTLKEEKKTYPNITEEDVRARYKDNHNQRIKDAQDYEKKRKARKFPDYLERLEEARKDYLEPWNYQVKGKLYKPDPGYGDGGYRGGNKIAYRELTPNEKYYIPINENQFGQREMSFGFLDFDSPMPIYDRRIVPQNLVAYEMPDKDRVEIYEYDPLAVKPYELRTPEEKAQWEELYGENRKTPTPQVTNNQRSLSSNSYPVYGPSKSLIGTVTSTGEFIPASYMGVNKADLDLLKNQQQLMQYLRSQGIATPLIKQQYGGTANLYDYLPQPLRFTFSQPVQIQAGPTTEAAEKQLQDEITKQVKLRKQRGIDVQPASNRQASIGQARQQTSTERKRSDKTRYEKNLEYAKATGAQFNYETGDVASPNEQTYGSGWGRAQYPALAQTMAGMTPSGDIQAGMIGAETLVDLLPGTGQITSAKRLGEFDYFDPNGGFWTNALGTVGLAGDILNVRAPLTYGSSNVSYPSSNTLPPAKTAGFNASLFKKPYEAIKKLMLVDELPEGQVTKDEIKLFRESPEYKKLMDKHLKYVKKYGPDYPKSRRWNKSLLNEEVSLGSYNPELLLKKIRKNIGRGIVNENRDFFNYLSSSGLRKKDIGEKIIMSGLIGTAASVPSYLAFDKFAPPAIKNKVYKTLGLNNVIPPTLSNQDTTIDITNRNMDFAKVNETADGQIIIGGEFIEDSNDTVRKAKDWVEAMKSLDDTYSDKKYRSKSIKSFYGIENGKFKVGKASEFKPDTEIVPRRFGAINIDKAVLNVMGGNTMRLLDKKGNPIYHNTPNTGKFILYSPSTKKAQFTYINSGESGVNKVNEFLKKNKDAQYIHLDNGRYEYYGINPYGLTERDFQAYYEQDLNRSGNPGYNLILKKTGGMTKFQNGGENIIDKARKDAEEYITGWYNSPKYKQRFQESLSPGEEYMIRGRERRLATIPSIEWVDSGPADYLAKTNPVAERDLQIKLNLAAHTPEALEEQSLAQSGAHELDHIINMGGRYIPKKTRQFISSIRPKSFRETPIYKKEIQPHMKMRKDFFDKILGGSGKWINKEEVNKILRNRNVQENWFSEPPPDNPSPDFYEALNYKFNYYNPAFKNKTETISFWNKIRQDAKELGIYDPYTEDFDKEKFDKFLQIGNTPKTRDFRKLIDWYGDPNIIIEGMNKIVKQDDSENMDMAREGGNVAQYQIGGAIRNAVRSVGSGAKRAAGSMVKDRKEIKITDPRKIRATTGKAINPNKDLVSGVYSTENLKKIVNAAKKNKLSLDDIYTLAAMDLQETGWGRADDNIGHVLHGEGVLPEDRFVNAYLNSINTANRLKFTDPYLRLQVYNGLGRVTPNTEKNYHGFRMQNIYGVPIPAGGISMRENPLYGKQIIDLRDNVLKTNADYINYVNWLYNQKQMGGSIQKYQNGGSWGNTPIMYTTDPRRIQASLDSMNLYNRFNTYIPGPQQGYNPKILSKDIREERKLMEAVKEAFPDYYRTSTPIKPVAIVGTVKNKTKPISRKNFATVRPIFVKPKYRYLKPVAETTTPQASASVVNVEQIPTAVSVQSVPVPNQQPVPVPNEVTDFAIVWADPNENPNSLTQKVKYFKTREEFDEAAKKLGATNISTMGKSAQANLGVRSNIPEFQYGGSKKKKKQTPSLKSSFGKMDVLGAAANAAMDRRRKERIARSLTKQMLSSMPTPQLGSFNPNVSESTNLNRSPEATTARISLDKAQQLNAQVAQMMRNNPGMSREQAANLINIPRGLSERRQAFVGPSRKLNTYEQKQADKYRYQANKQYALQNQDKGVTFNYNTGDLAFNNDQTAQSGDWGRVYPSALSQTIGSFTPQRYEDYTAPGGAGDVGAETFVNMNPLISGQILSASRLANLATNPTNNQYWSGDNTWWQNTLGGLGFLGDVTMAGMVRPGRPWGNMNQRFVPRGMNENFQFLNPRTGAPLSRTSSIVGSTQPQVPVRQMLNLTDDQLVLLEQEADDLAGGLSSETPGITSEQYMEQLKRDEIRKSMGDFLRKNPVNTFDTDIIDPWFRNSSTKDFAGYVEGYMEELGLDSKNPADVEKFRSMFIKDELDRFNSEHKPTSSSFLESRIPGYEGGSLPPADPIKDLTFRNPWKPDEIVYQVDPDYYNNFATAKDYQAALKHFTDYKRSWLMNRVIKPRNAAMDELKFNLSGGLRPFEWQRFTPDDLNFLASQVKGAAPFEGGRFPGTRNPSGNIRLNLNKGRPLNFEDEIKNALNQTPEEKQKIINTFRDYLNRPNSSNKYGGSTGYQKGGQIGKNYYIGKSKIQGDGVFAKRNIQPGEYIGKVHTIIEPYIKYQFEDLGRKHNHSERPNVQNVLIGNERHLFATKPIRKNQELTSNYRLQPDLEQPEGFAEKNKRKMEYGGVSKKSTGLIPEIPKLFKKEYGGPLKRFHQGKMTGPGIFQKGGDITKSSLPSSKKNSYIYNGGSLSFSKNKKVKIKLK